MTVLFQNIYMCARAGEFIETTVTLSHPKHYSPKEKSITMHHAASYGFYFVYSFQGGAAPDTIGSRTITGGACVSPADSSARTTYIRNANPMSARIPACCSQPSPISIPPIATTLSNLTIQSILYHSPTI